jgi:hypothetical protein
MARHEVTSPRAVYSDFNEFERLPDGRVRIVLGPQPLSLALEPLADARDDENVELVLPEELEAEGVLQSEPFEGGVYWYAILPNWEAIRNIHPEASARDEPTGAPPARNAQAS